MILTLQVVGERAQDLGAESRKVFKAMGGTIGRYPDNDWIFPDPYVSGRHALIRYVNGEYFIEDTSTNGVFINSLDNRLPKAQVQPLHDGDRLYIDAYEIEVSIREDAATKSRGDLRALLAEGLAPPSGRTSGAPTGSQNPASEAVTRGRFDAMLQAAGLEGLDANRDAAQVLGQLLRLALGGIMEMLQARERMKDELRLPPAAFKKAHNNPLEFSANVDEAFDHLLLKRNPAYLSPIEALEDALHDLRDHHDASLAAMRVAFEALLARFEPDRLEEAFDRQLKKGSIFGVPAKLRYWDLYRERYTGSVTNAEAAFRDLFAEEFARTYEEQRARRKAL